MVVDLKGRTAVVTGGGTGIGRSVSLALARCGASLVINYSQSQTEAEQTAQTIQQNGGGAVAVRADVKKEEQVAALMEAAVDTFGGLEIVVANAAVAVVSRPP